MVGEGQPPMEDASLREITDLYSELRFMAAHGRRPNHDEIPQYYVCQLVGEFILHTNVDYTDFGSDFYGVGKGRLANRHHAHGPSHSGGDGVNSRPSHGDRSSILRYVSNDEVHHMSVEDLRSLYFECRDYIYGIDISTRECGYRTDYVDFAYDIEHGQASFLDSMVDDICREYATSASMPTDVQQTFLESSIATEYERVSGAGPSREFEEPRVDLTFDLT
eukprot:Gb_24201 [translate_table: standard]